MVKRQRFTAEFKREAVRLLDAGERPASEVTIDLGICRNQLYTWQTDRVGSGELSFLVPLSGPLRTLRCRPCDSPYACIGITW